MSTRRARPPFFTATRNSDPRRVHLRVFQRGFPPHYLVERRANRATGRHARSVRPSINRQLDNPKKRAYSSCQNIGRWRYCSLPNNEGRNNATANVSRFQNEEVFSPALQLASTHNTSSANFGIRWRCVLVSENIYLFILVHVYAFILHRLIRLLPL